MNEESDATIYRRMFVDVWRELHKLRCDHDTLMQVLVEEMPVTDRMRLVDKYDARREKLWEDTLLKLEEKLPKLAADLDAHRPLLPPDEKGGKP